MFKISSFSVFPFVVAALLSGSAFGQTTNVVCAKSGFREDFQQGVVLTATSNAPAGASGKAQIVAINDNGTNTSVLFVKTTGLTNGTYYVSLTQLGNSNITSLGSLNVAGSPGCFRFGHRHGRGHGGGYDDGDRHGNDDGDDDDEDDDDGERGDGDRDDSYRANGNRGDGDRSYGDHGDWISSSFTNWLTRCSRTDSAFRHLVCGGVATNRFRTNIYHWYTNCLTVGSGSFLLPSGLVQSNVAEILISDSNGDVVLFGDFSGVTNSTSVYIETVDLVPGTATNLQGTATLTLITRNGKGVGVLKLYATGLDPLEKLYLTANGTNTCRVRTSASGTLKVKTLPRINLFNLQTLVATDVSSNIVFTADF